MPAPTIRIEELSPVGAALYDAAAALGLPVSVKDGSSGAYLLVNEPMAALLGRPVGHVLGLTDNELLPADEAALLRRADDVALSTPQAGPGEVRLERGGLARQFRVLRRHVGGGATPGALLSLWLDDTETLRRGDDLKRALQQIERQQAVLENLRRDSRDAPAGAVPGLYQQSQFEDQLRREVDLSVREHREFALVMVALDPPGEAVRAFGGDAAQRIVASLGQLLRANTRAMDAPCRLGDERFAVLLSGVGLATAHARMEGLRRQCATQIVAHQGEQLSFSVSMGVASFPHTAATLETLRQAADAALDEARRRGGNRIVLASIRLDAAALGDV